MKVLAGPRAGGRGRRPRGPASPLAAAREISRGDRNCRCGPRLRRLSGEGRNEDAEKLTRATLDIFHSVGLPDDAARVIGNLQRLAHILDDRNQPDQAQKIYDQIDRLVAGWDAGAPGSGRQRDAAHQAIDRDRQSRRSRRSREPEARPRTGAFRRQQPGDRGGARLSGQRAGEGRARDRSRRGLQGGDSDPARIGPPGRER